MKYKEEDLKVGVEVRTDNGFIGIVNEIKKFSVIIQHSNSLWEYPNNRIVEVLIKKKEQDKATTPSHYNNGKGYDVIDFCNDYKLNFNRGSAIKYLSRAGKKDNEIDDLKKAIDFIQREIKHLENENRG
jgi:hypothetical protein